MELAGIGEDLLEMIIQQSHEYLAVVLTSVVFGMAIA